MKVTAIVPAAGTGLRIAKKKKGVRKPFFIVKDKPILIHTLLALADSKRISDIIVVVHKDDVKKCGDAVRRFNLKGIRRIISGGKTRFESVKKGLSCLPGDSDIVFIHDGVRPFIDRRMITDSIDACAKFGACVCGVPVVSTIKSVDKDLTVKTTPDRRTLYIIQTPQVFKRDTLCRAYDQSIRDTSWITDDAMLVERLGHKIKMVNGSYKNIKITTLQDLVLMEALLK